MDRSPLPHLSIAKRAEKEKKEREVLLLYGMGPILVDSEAAEGFIALL
jgi:hypothetical protein